MRKLITLLAVAAGAAALSQAAMAEPAPPPAQGGQHITVDGDRVICRRVVRANSRMRSGRLCRSREEWRRNGISMTSARDSLEGIENSVDVTHAATSTNERFGAPETGGAGPY
jgi:hypothetical protein